MCQERVRLAGNYESAVRELSRTLAVLNARIGELPGDKDDRLRQAGENCRNRLDHARRALQRHLEEHGC